MATTRIYLAVVGDTRRLVRASHPSPVVQHVSRSLIKVSIPTQDELIACAKAGIEPEELGSDHPQLPIYPNE